MFNFLKKLKRKDRGMALLEIIIGASVITVGILAVVTSYNLYFQYALANESNAQAGYLLEEGLEVVSFMRDGSWSENIATLATSTDYYLSFVGSSWATTTEPQYVDGRFLRSFVMSDVYRDINDDISSSGAIDPNTKEVTVNVSFLQGHSTTTKSISTYITNIYDN